MVKLSQLHPGTILSDPNRGVVGVVKEMNFSDRLISISWSDGVRQTIGIDTLGIGKNKRIKAINLKDFPLVLMIAGQPVPSRIRQDKIEQDESGETKLHRFVRRLDLINSGTLTEEALSYSIGELVPAHVSSLLSMLGGCHLAVLKAKVDSTNPAIVRVKIETPWIPY